MGFLLTKSCETLNYTEHEERITQYPSTHLMHFTDWGPMTADQPLNLDYIDPESKYIELDPQSRPGYIRLYHNSETKIEAVLAILRKQKSEELKEFYLIPQDFDALTPFSTFSGVIERDSMLFDPRKVLQSDNDITEQRTFKQDYPMVQEGPKRVVSQIIKEPKIEPSLNHLTGHEQIMFVSSHETDGSIVSVKFYTDSQPYTLLQRLEIPRQDYVCLVIPSDGRHKPDNFYFVLTTNK